MSMRGQIAEVIENELGHAGLEYIADAILEALPDMIPPLVWESEDDLPRICDAVALNTLYRVILMASGEGSLRINQMNREHSKHPTPEQAKAAANTLHRDAIMAAFKGDVS
jgi:hypothetical protein